MKLLTQQLLNSIDQVSVTNAIREHKLLEYEYDEVSDALILACDNWLTSDLTWDSCMTEIKGIHNELSFVFDLVLIDENKKAKLVDWKTGAIDAPNYESKQKFSDQTSIYLGPGAEWLSQEHGLTVTGIEYRCMGDKGKTKVFGVGQTSIESNSWNAITQHQAITISFDNLLKYSIWPRNRPMACFAGGSTCPFLDDCNNMTMPRSFDAETIKPPRSKSAFKAFLHCPEQYRRTYVLGHEITPPSHVVFGNAFHAGASNIWDQVFKAHKGDTT